MRPMREIPVSVAAGWIDATMDQGIPHFGPAIASEPAQAYRDALVEYFTEHQGSLSADSLARLERNPLRILDSKDEKDRRIVANAPTGLSRHG